MRGEGKGLQIIKEGIECMKRWKRKVDIPIDDVLRRTLVVDDEAAEGT